VSGRTKALNSSLQNLQIIGGIQSKYLGVYTLHPPQVCTLLSLTSGGRKNKRTELILHGVYTLHLPQVCTLLSLTSGGRKNKKTKLDNRRLTLRACYAKVGKERIRAPFPLVKMLRETGLCYHWLQVWEKWKKYCILDNRRLHLRHAKVVGGGQKH